MRTCEISQEQATTFLSENRVQKEHVSVGTADVWIGAFDADELIGTIGISFGRNKDRIKCFFVKPERRRSGVGDALLSEAVKAVRAKEITAFSTEASRGLFKKYNFAERSVNGRGIAFMERRT